MEEASLTAAVDALRAAGYEPVVAETPKNWSIGESGTGAWIKVSGAGGPETYILVTVRGLLRNDKLPEGWSEAYGAGPSAPVVMGYQVSVHERPFRSRGHSFGDWVERVLTVFVDDVVAAVRDWADWESTWSVVPVVEPAARRLARLRRLAASRLGGAGIAIDVDLDRWLLSDLGKERADALHRILDEVFEPGIRWRFPRDRTGGKLATRLQVLLHECRPPANPAGKGIWLVVEGPPPRAEQRLTVRLVEVVGKAQKHRWDHVPEYWRAGPRTLDELWGIDADVSAAFVDGVVDHLLAGRGAVALELCGIRTDESVQRLLAGRPDRFELRQWTDRWVAGVTAAMADAAPWRWRHAVAPKQRPQRMVGIGGPNPNTRPGLFLVHRGGHVELSFDQSASPLVLPRVRWERDVDYDLVRHGLLSRDRIPMPS